MIKSRNASALSDVGLKNTYKIGYLERGRVGMGFAFWMLLGGYYPVLKVDMWKRSRAFLSYSRVGTVPFTPLGCATRRPDWVQGRESLRSCVDFPES